MELAPSMGIYRQLPLFETPPMYTIDEEYLVSCMIRLTWINEDGDEMGSTSDTDHPSFANLRDRLSRSGHLKVDTRCVNGDTVLKDFYFNDVIFVEGERFPSACAMIGHLKYKVRYGYEM